MPTGLSRGAPPAEHRELHRVFPGVASLLPLPGGDSTIHTASTSKITPPIDRDPIVKCSSARSSSPSPMRSTATVAAVVSILRSTRCLTARSREAVISTNGTSAIFGPIPISSTRNVSIAPAAVIDVWSSSKRGRGQSPAPRPMEVVSEPSPAHGRVRPDQTAPRTRAAAGPLLQAVSLGGRSINGRPPDLPQSRWLMFPPLPAGASYGRKDHALEPGWSPVSLAEYIIFFVLVVSTGVGVPGPGDAALIAAGALAGEGSNIGGVLG